MKFIVWYLSKNKYIFQCDLYLINFLKIMKIDFQKCNQCNVIYLQLS